MGGKEFLKSQFCAYIVSKKSALLLQHQEIKLWVMQQHHPEYLRLTITQSNC